MITNFTTSLYGVRDGVRSRNIRSHSAALFQLSYSHQVYAPNLVSHYSWQEGLLACVHDLKATRVVERMGIEPMSSGFSDQRSDLISYLSICECLY